MADDFRSHHSFRLSWKQNHVHFFKEGKAIFFGSSGR